MGGARSTRPALGAAVTRLCKLNLRQCRLLGILAQCSAHKSDRLDMRSTTGTILAGTLGVFVGFGTDLVSYLQGIDDQGGAFSDINSITIASIVLTSLVSGAGALMLLLADPPEGKRLVNSPAAPVKSVQPEEFDSFVDLGPAEERGNHSGGRANSVAA